MTEWLKVHAWKVCIPQKGIASSNLAFSAESRNKYPIIDRAIFGK